MFKKYVLPMAAAVLFWAPLAQAEMKIVVVDTVRAILATEEAQTLVDAAAKEVEAERVALEDLAKEIQGIQEKVQKDAEIMSDAEKRKVQKDMENLRIDFDFRRQKLQKEAQDKQNEILQVLAPRFEKVLKDLIEIEGIEIVLAPNAVVYANSITDITRRLTEKMNESQD